MATVTERIASGSIVLADFQTAGRGQMGNSWESDAACNLTFSILFCPANISANNSFVISEMASLSVKYTLDLYISGISVKWPNDIYYQNRKIAGILIENTIERGRISKSIIGIGLNVNQTEFHSDAPNPVSMAQAAGRLFDRMAIMNDFRRIFAIQSARVDQSCFATIHDEYVAALYRGKGYFMYVDGDGVF
jgi:BirA family biotin operon repressor/biotin-[acetyl-CoA-carboxylase] ligase